FGKTENTMVLPEYRTKILYPRFEKRFAAEYEPRYHALFSTMGPAAAIRQRKALGYEATQCWLQLEHAAEPLGSLVRLSQHPRLGIIQKSTALLLKLSVTSLLPEGVEVLSGQEAISEPFFQDYWANSQCNWGVAPSRAPADLAWRYWNNPYSDHYAI